MEKLVRNIVFVGKKERKKEKSKTKHHCTMKMAFHPSRLQKKYELLLPP